MKRFLNTGPHPLMAIPLVVGLYLAALFLGLAFGCIPAPGSDCRPPTFRAKIETGTQWTVEVDKATVEGHRYLIFREYHWGGPVHDPACPCFTRAPEVR